jgi:hypothetical protein
MKLFPLDFADCKNVIVVPTELHGEFVAKFCPQGIRVVKCDALEKNCVMADPDLFQAIKEME